MGLTDARAIVAMIFVDSVERTAEFYRHLGFRVDNTFAPPGQEELSWAWLESGRAQLMAARATSSVIPEQQAVLFYLYVDNVAATRDLLVGEGLDPGPIVERFYAPQGEFRVTDPDGYTLMITQ